jgi:hypothetical protein
MGEQAKRLLIETETRISGRESVTKAAKYHISYPVIAERFHGSIFSTS